MSSKMNSELTMEQMESTSGGNALLQALARIAVETGAVDFYVELGKNLYDGQDFSEAAYNAGRDAGVPGMEGK